MRPGILLLFPLINLAQDIVAPTNEPVGTVRGDDLGAYNVTSSFEAGYRFRTVDGNLGKYRSDVNFGNGIRLLSGNLTVHSKEGHGGYFDELLISTQGLGNDPYEFSSFRVQKNRVYRYDLIWRQQDYYNPALSVAAGQHFMDTTRRLHDHFFTLLPQSKLKLFLGYSRNSQSGPALSTTQFASSDEFPLFERVRRLQDEYRIGNEFEFAGVKLSWMRSWERFRDDSIDFLNTPGEGNNPGDRSMLNSFQRSQPYHGTTSSWRVNLIANQSKLYNVNGRFTYAEGRRRFLFDETAIGTNRFGGALNRQILLFGDGRRPVAAANLTLSVFPASKVTVVNHTSFHNTRMEGDGTYRELNNAFLIGPTIHFQLLGVRTIANATDVQLQASRWAMVYTGYHFSTRRIRSRQQQVFDNIPDTAQSEQDNTLHAGVVGLRLKLAKLLTINLDGEIGRADKPIYPISEKNYHALSGRAQYKTRSMLLAAGARTNYNTNSFSISYHSSRARTYFADASWTPLEWFGFDASYSKLHLDTTSALAYFLAGDLVHDRSIYRSNIHSGHLNAHFSVRKRVDIFAGFSRVQDTGASGALAMRSLPLVPFPGPLRPFPIVQVYPLSFTSPLARVSVRLHTKLRWNAGYQRYSYKEDFLDRQDYRAHTGYTSLTWSF